jgi:hypothetical protein
MAEPERVTGQVAQTIEEEKDVCYAPPIWRYIMAAIRLIRMCARILGPVGDYFRLRRSSDLRF